MIIEFGGNAPVTTSEEPEAPDPGWVDASSYPELLHPGPEGTYEGTWADQASIMVLPRPWMKNAVFLVSWHVKNREWVRAFTVDMKDAVAMAHHILSEAEKEDHRK
jgi:hypothetical protein